MWHEGEEDRIVLICDCWHPQLDVTRHILPTLSTKQREAFDAALAGKHLPLERTSQGLTYSQQPGGIL